MKLCPKCKQQTLLYQNGCYVDHDSWLCINQECDYEHVLEVSTYSQNSAKERQDNDYIFKDES